MMDKYNISQEDEELLEALTYLNEEKWKNIIMGYIQSLKEENQFKEDRISDLLVERDMGKWITKIKVELFEDFDRLLEYQDDQTLTGDKEFWIFPNLYSRLKFKHIGSKGGKLISNYYRLNKPKVSKSHNNQQNKRSEVSGNSSQS